MCLGGEMMPRNNRISSITRAKHGRLVEIHGRLGEIIGLTR